MKVKLTFSKLHNNQCVVITNAIDSYFNYIIVFMFNFENRFENQQRAKSAIFKILKKSLTIDQLIFMKNRLVYIQLYIQNKICLTCV